MSMLRRAARLAIVVFGVASASSVFAAPRIGDGWTPMRLRDAWDRTRELATNPGKPALVVYEDKDSATMNAAFKQELANFARGDRYRTQVVLIAVADVTGYDYWPIRGFVKDAIRGESIKQGTIIYCDWDGSFRAALKLTASTSNIVLYGKDGMIAFAKAGALTSEERQEVFRLLRRETE